MVIHQDFLKELNIIFDEKRIESDKSKIKKYFPIWDELERGSSCKFPKLKISVETSEQIQKILYLAKKYKIKIIPVSSNTIFQKYSNKSTFQENSILLDLSKMKKIIKIDRKNRSAIIEPGVTYSKLIPKLHTEGLRIIMPLHPQGNKSVVTSCLERVPTTIPKYHWDTFDPLLCLETYFGNGKMFRTGSAAGPGSLEEQYSSGQSHVNPMGPAQCNLGGVMQGAMGTLGIITWASLKCELLPLENKMLLLKSKDLQSLLNITQFCVKYRFGDETLILNHTALSNLISPYNDEKDDTFKNLKDYFILIINLAGSDEFAQDKITYQEEEIINEMKKFPSLSITSCSEKIKQAILQTLQTCSEPGQKPWNLLNTSCRELFFLSPMSDITQHYSFFKENINPYSSKIVDIGIYIQPMVQGCNYHVQFDIYFDSTTFEREKKEVIDIFQTISHSLIKHGAFFARPYGSWREIFNHIEPQTKEVLNKVKKIFDPHNILNPDIIPYK